MRKPAKRMRVGILAGGCSAERQISLLSGKAVFDVLNKLGYKTVFIDIKRRFEKQIKKGEFDVAFIAVHGAIGEDGTIQRFLQGLNIPYTGSDAAGSLNAFDKIISKQIFESNNIPIGPYTILDREKKPFFKVNPPSHKKNIKVDSFGEAGPPSHKKNIKVDSFGEVFAPKNKKKESVGTRPWSFNFKGKVVVKPSKQGSSVGLSVLKSTDRLDKALRSAFRYSDQVIVEKFLEGREITVGIINEKPLAPIEILARNGIYDYNAKYNDPKTAYITNPDLSEKDIRHIRRTAFKAHKCLGLSQFSRIDMKLSDNGDIFVLEANTIPGLTRRSLLPKACETSGISFEKMCVYLLKSAFKKKEK